MSDQDLEQHIRATGADRAPRVTPADIEAEIASEHYFTGQDGVVGEMENAGLDSRAFAQTHLPPALGLLTFCVLVLRNGFTATGESACASPENFNAAVGQRIARENAIAKVRPLLGFRLRDKLHAVDTAIQPEPGADQARA